MKRDNKKEVMNALIMVFQFGINMIVPIFLCTLLHISCTLYKKAMNSLHRLHSVYFAAQKREFYAKSTRVSSRRSSASICRMASRIILPVIFVATGVLFSGGSCGFAPATSCV